MDPVVWAVLAVVLAFSLWRLSRTFRSVRSDRGKEIQDKLEELRKKRDEQ
jgi:hypothetical protein